MSMNNPYVTNIGKVWEGIPVRRMPEQEAIKEGFAIRLANGYRVRSKSRHNVDHTHTVKKVA